MGALRRATGAPGRGCTAMKGTGVMYLVIKGLPASALKTETRCEELHWRKWVQEGGRDAFVSQLIRARAMMRLQSLSCGHSPSWTE
jgi:hypothetical protein